MDWNRVQGPVRRELAQVDRQLALLFRSPIGIINQVATHFLGTRGKMFRPTLLLLVSRLEGKADRSAIASACVVEIIHVAALIHDDSVDQSLFRRGLPTVNHLWNDDVAIIIGDFLYSKAFTKMVEDDLHPAMEVLARVSHEMALGEALEFEQERNLEVSEEQYLEVIRAKTASLFAGACSLGASTNGGADDRNRVRRFQSFGADVGMAFQITDDVLDFVGDPSATGKGVGDDLRGGKITLPIIHGLGHAGRRERRRLAALATKGQLDANEWRELVGILDRLGSVEYARARAHTFARRARRALVREPASPIRDALDAAVQYAVSRQH